MLDVPSTSFCLTLYFFSSREFHVALMKLCERRWYRFLNFTHTKLNGNLYLMGLPAGCSRDLDHYNLIQLMKDTLILDTVCVPCINHLVSNPFLFSSQCLNQKFWLEESKQDVLSSVWFFTGMRSASQQCSKCFFFVTNFEDLIWPAASLSQWLVRLVFEATKDEISTTSIEYKQNSWLPHYYYCWTLIPWAVFYIVYHI